LLADHVSKIGTDVVIAMLRLVIFVYVCALILLVIYSLIIWMRAGGYYWSSISALRETFLVALGTSSSFASIPSALRGLHDNLKFEKKTSDLVIPLGVTLNPQGTVVHFAISIIFIAQIYAVSLGFKELLLIIIGSILAGLAATSVPGLAGLSMISIALIPLGLPYAVAVILLAAIDPILDPVLTTVNVYGNCAATALIAKLEKGQKMLSGS
jgi:Na+/H+-dicarboxylate symporter